MIIFEAKERPHHFYGPSDVLTGRLFIIDMNRETSFYCDNYVYFD
jgi:hypothetical protein